MPNCSFSGPGGPADPNYCVAPCMKWIAWVNGVKVNTGNATGVCCKSPTYDCSMTGCVQHPRQGTGAYPDLATCQKFCCQGKCPCCQQVPQMWKFAVVGVTNGNGCTTCDNLNGIYHVAYNSITTSTCLWQTQSGNITCGGHQSLVTWRVNFACNNGGLIQGLGLTTGDNGSVAYQSTSPSNVHCCGDNVIPFLSASICSNWPSTITMSPEIEGACTACPNLPLWLEEQMMISEDQQTNTKPYYKIKSDGVGDSGKTLIVKSPQKKPKREIPFQ